VETPGGWGVRHTRCSAAARGAMSCGAYASGTVQIFFVFGTVRCVFSTDRASGQRDSVLYSDSVLNGLQTSHACREG